MVTKDRVWLGAVLFLGVVLYIAVFRDPSPHPPSQYEVVQPHEYMFGSSTFSDQPYFSLSPDEHWLVYAAFRNQGPLYVDKLDVYVRDLTSDTSRRVTIDAQRGWTSEDIARELRDACWVVQGLAFPSNDFYYQKLLVPSQGVIVDVAKDTVQTTCEPLASRISAIVRPRTEWRWDVRSWNSDGPGRSWYRVEHEGSDQDRRIALIKRLSDDGTEVELVRRASNRTGWEIERVTVSPGERYIAYQAQEFSHWDSRTPFPPDRDIRLFVYDTATGKDIPFGSISTFQSATWTSNAKSLYFMEDRVGICRIRLDAD